MIDFFQYISSTAVKWLKYLGYGVKTPINQQINQSIYSGRLEGSETLQLYMACTSN